jgi:ABC-type branched-subunit amino acid transport system substrate-binding protein
VLHSNDIFGNTTKTVFETTVGADKIVYSSAIIDDNIKGIALKALNAKPEVVYIGSMSSNLGSVIKEMKVLGYEGEFITTDAFAYDYINSLAGEYSKGVIYVDFISDGTKYKEFADLYKKKFNSDCNSTAVICYDGLSLLIDELLRNNKNLDFLNDNITFEGIYGTLTLKDREIIYPVKALRWK